MTNLTRHFFLEEFLVSHSHPELIEDYRPIDSEIDRLYMLCELGLERIRERWGPVIIYSGLRPMALNKAVGGSTTSQHVSGRAADFACTDKANMGFVYDWTLRVLKWPGELFYYRGKGHIHIALPQYGVTVDRGVREE